MASARGLTLLHLSDLHFGEHHNFAEEGFASLLERVRQDADRGDSTGPLVPDLVLVTGDLTYHGLPSEFRLAEAFLVGVAERFEVERRRVVIVPGNHDVSWAKCRSYFDDCASNEEEPVWPYWPKWRNFVDFLRRFYGDDEAAPAFVEPQPWTFHDFPELATVVAGLNSTMAETHRDGEHYGFVGEAQLRAFESKLTEAAGRGYLRIAALHHDVLAPVHPRSREDAKDLRRILGPHVNLVVHGHQHEGEITYLGSATPIFGIGSAGVTRERRPAEVPNQYEWIRIFADRFEVGGRSWSTGQKRFVDDVTIDPQGRSGWISQPVAFTGISTFAARDRAELSAAASAAFDEERRARGIDQYRGHLVRTLEPLPLSSMASRGRDHGLVVRLRQVFVAPSAVIEWPRGDLAEEEGGDGEERSLARRGERRPELPVDVLHLVGDPLHRWFFVMGAPGAGKTSLVRWFCTSPEALLSHGSLWVPVLIELSRFHRRYVAAEQAGRSPYTFFDFLADHLEERSVPLGADDFRALAEQGRLYWCFDALDEVPDTRARMDYFEQIQGLAASYPGCRGMITCRVAAAEPFRGRLADPCETDAGGFVPCALRPFDRGQVDEFLDRWHEVVFADDPAVGGHRRRRIADALERSPALAELAGTPLLLTLLAVLSRGQEMPSLRHRLYEDFLELMAEHWDANEHQRVADRFRLATKRRYLREVAWAMTEASHDGSPQNWLTEAALRRVTVEFCRREFGEGYDEAVATTEALLRQISERDFILAYRGDETFCFVHKAIFEYCAATEICERFGRHEWTLDQVAALAASHWWDESWGEILRMVGAVLAEREPRHAVVLLQGIWATLRADSRDGAISAAWFDAQDAVAAAAWSVRLLGGVENLGAAPIRGLLGRLGAIIEHLSISRFRHVRTDWPSWVRVAPMLPMVHPNRTRIWPGHDDNAALFLAAAAGREGRPTWLGQLVGSGSSHYRLSGLGRLIATLGPWTEAERSILIDLARDHRTAAWDLVALVHLGIDAAHTALVDRVSRGDPDALMVLMRSQSPADLRELATRRILEMASANPGELLHCHPDVVEDLAEPELRARVFEAVARHIETRPLAAMLPDDSLRALWLEYLADEGKVGLDGAWPRRRADRPRRVRRGPTRIADAAAQGKCDGSIDPWLLTLDDLITALLREGLPRRAEVRLRGRLVGHLEESPTDNTTRFTYHPDYLAAADAVPISPTLPLRPAPYERDGLHPFFAGLLPQGWLHENLVDKYHLRESDEFGLLLATGADTIGAVEVVPVDEDPRARYRQGHHARLSDLPR